MSEVEKIERLARLIYFVLRQADKRALIMGGTRDLTCVTIDGTFDLIRVARALREAMRNEGSGDFGTA